MGSRENAFNNFVFGGGKGFNESDIDIGDLQEFQDLSNIGLRNNGQLRYQDYPKDGRDQFKHTVGRTGVGGITRGKMPINRNTINIKDRYDFNSQGQSVDKQAELARRALSKGDPVSALGQVAPNFGTNFDTNINIPVSLQQQKNEGYDVPYDPENTVIGGRKYRWVTRQLKNGEGWDEIARQAFADNPYKPEGANLQNYSGIIQKQNRGVVGDIVYYPEPVDQGGIFGAALNMAKKFLGR